MEDVSSLISDETYQLDDVLPLIENGKAYKLVNSENDREFIVMENIQKRGLNQYVQGHGLLVYHVDYSKASVNMNDTPNNNPGHPAVAAVPAGGLLINNRLRGNGKQYTTEQWLATIAACPFPGTQNVTSLTTDMELPNYCFYNDNTVIPTRFMLNDITEDTQTGNVSFTIAPEEPTGINVVRWNHNDAQDPIYDLQGRKILGPLKAGIYIVQGKKIVVK